MFNRKKAGMIGVNRFECARINNRRGRQRLLKTKAS